MSLPDQLNPAEHAWMNDPGVLAVFRALKKAGAEARFVGGVVRDALRGDPVGDIDLAVNRPPEIVVEILQAAGIRVVPTGIDHGTITAVIGHKGYELTTLRRDIETDGRRAKVIFTEDWQVDAGRRDLTFNALYADEGGRIYDYFNGRADLAAGRVRFIGRPTDRIREDVLRLLRFFRFLAQFGGEADPEALSACASLAPLLPGLSVERVWREISRMLEGRELVNSLKLMKEGKILYYILPEVRDLKRLARLIEIEKSHLQPERLRHLACLLPGGHAAVAKRLRLSRAESQRLIALGQAVHALQTVRLANEVRQTLYDFGQDAVRDALWIVASEGREELLEFQPVATNWENPVFPLQGKTLLAEGVPAGPRGGEILTEVEAWWRRQDFKPDAEACRQEALRILTVEAAANIKI